MPYLHITAGTIRPPLSNPFLTHYGFIFLGLKFVIYFIRYNDLSSNLWLEILYIEHLYRDITMKYYIYFSFYIKWHVCGLLLLWHIILIQTLFTVSGISSSQGTAVSPQSTWWHRQPIRPGPHDVSTHHSGQREVRAAHWLSTAHSTAVLARWTPLAAISMSLEFGERARQSHQKHTEPKDGIKIPLIHGGWPERKSENLIQNRIKQDIDWMNLSGCEPPGWGHPEGVMKLRQVLSCLNGDQGLTWSQGLLHRKGMDSVSPACMEIKKKASPNSVSC